MQSTVLTGEEVHLLTIEALSFALREAFATMVGLEVNIGPVLPAEADAVDGKLVAGLIGWVGHWSGTGVLECTPEFACVLTNLLLGTELTSLDEDALNCIAEMANIVFGNMKTSLEGVLGELRLGLPTVIYGSQVGIWTPHDRFATLPITIGRHFLKVKVHMECERESHA